MSDTPRTDDLRAKAMMSDDPFQSMVDHARDLERELAEGPDGWNLSCEKCGASTAGPCGWPTNCPTGLNSRNAARESMKGDK